ncbi:MAG: glycosyltransferase family 39 protein [Clostridia bacterium]
MLNKENIKKISIILVFILAIIIRIVNWPYTMEEINCDEAMTAINAKAIADTNCDMYGTQLPIYFESWLVGGQSALLTYLMAITIKILGFSVISIRLPSLIISIISIYIFDKLIQEIFGKNYKIRIIMLLTLALNPWHIMQSVWVLDCNLFPHFMLYAIYILIKGINNNKRYLIYISMIVFGITVYSYGIALYATPLFLVISLLYLLKNKKIKFIDIIICFIIFITITWPIILMSIINLFDLPTIKIGFFTIQNFEYFKRTDDMLIFSNNFIQTLFDNFKSTGKLLINNEDGLIWNALTNIGTIYFGSLIFVIISIINLVKKNKEEKYNNISAIIIWLIVSIIIGLLINNVNVNRLNIIWYPIIILIGHGIYVLLKEFKFNTYLTYMLLTIYLLYNIIFLVKFHNTNYDEAYTWSNGLIETIEQIKELSKEECIYVSYNTINNDKEKIFWIYETKKMSKQKEFIDRRVLINEESNFFEDWIENEINIKLIDIENVTDSMNYIIVYKDEFNDKFNNYNIKNYGNYKILEKRGE